ncbi:MAG: hypothetical protein AB7E60_14770 [Sphingobium sp.]
MHNSFILSATGGRILLCLVALSLPLAGAKGQILDRPRDDGLLNIPDVTIERPEIDAPVLVEDVTPTGEHPPELGDDDLKANPRIATLVLGTSVRQQNWRTVRRVIGYYKEIPGHDPMLALYAQGALDRQDSKHGNAIAA